MCFQIHVIQNKRETGPDEGRGVFRRSHILVYYLQHEAFAQFVEGYICIAEMRGLVADELKEEDIFQQM